MASPDSSRSDQDLLDRVARCRRHHDVLAVNGGVEVVFDWELANADGARFELFREPHHTDEDITKAKAKLRADRDVVGLRVTRVKMNFTKPISAEYQSDGIFFSRGDEIDEAGLGKGDECVVLTKAHYQRMQRALEVINHYPVQPIWGDDRDDAADDMVRIAEDTLAGKDEETEVCDECGATVPRFDLVVTSSKHNEGCEHHPATQLSE